MQNIFKQMTVCVTFDVILKTQITKTFTKK